MKLGAENNRKTIIAGVLFVIAVVMVIRMFMGPGTPAETANAIPTASPESTHTTRGTGARRNVRGGEKTATAVTPSLDPRLHLGALKEVEDTKYDGTGRNIFMATEEPRIPTPVAPGMTDHNKSAINTPPPPKQTYTPPPINLKFFGFASGPDHKRVFLASGDDVFVATEGDIVQRRYKIVKVNSNNIEVLDVLSNNRQTIPLTAG